MQIQKYAPVLIPTLNRYEHLRRCVESLANNKLAKETELVIGLDYPPQDKYKEGWKKIKYYLPTIEGFGKVTILCAEENIGAVNNSNKLKSFVLGLGYNSFIFTEDDNEFSPLFLEYINEGLIKYKNNPNVYAVCGYNPPISQSDYPSNIYASYGQSAWGVGYWSDRTIKYDLDEIKRTLKRPTQMMKIYRRSPNLVYALLDMLDKGLVWGDTCIPFYNIINNSFCIFPRISFVRNWGHDGSGINCGEGADELFVNQRIFSGENFNMDEIEIKETESKAVKKYIRQTYNYKKRIRLLIKIAKFYLKNNG